MPTGDPFDARGFGPGDAFVAGTLGPGAALPVCRSIDVKGGAMQVETLADRDAIPGALLPRDDPAQLRQEGMLVFVQADQQTYQLLGGIGNGNWVTFTTGGGGTRVSEDVTPAQGQTAFPLAFVPSQPDQVDFFVNTVKYVNGVNYTVAGNTLTWLDTPFLLDPSDAVEIIYFV